MEKQFTLSYTLQSAKRRLAEKGSIPAILLASEILSNHDDYVRGLLTDTKKELQEWLRTKEVNKSPGNNTVSQLHAEEWIVRVGELFDDTVVRELHGRNVLIGLSLMDDELRRILTHNDFLKKLIDELKEDIEDILTPKGKQLYKAVLPEETASSSTAYVDSQPDNPVTEPNDDKLGRKEFAEFLVQLLNSTSLRMGAYALHIFAPWGFGKTSVFNFMKTIMNRDRLKDGKPRWVYVDFNAWQNQHLTHPWWTLMNTIYQNVKKHLSWRFRLKEWWWRFSSSKLHYLIGIGVLTWLVALLVIPLYKTTRSVDDISKIFENIGKVVAGVLAVWAFVVGISRNSFVSSQKAVENYLGSKDEPMEAFKLRFHKLVIALGEETRLIVFIDDLDRCKSEFVVKILENIQTLFKEANVVFAIAADKKWIHACYEVEYEKMKGYVGVEGKTIGPLFVEKMFQLSVPLPGVHPFQKEKFWQHLIGLGDGPATYLDEHTIAVIDEASGVQERENLIKFAEQQGFERSHAVRREIVVRMAKKGTLKHTEHYLERYSKLLDVNPRSMKRLLNSFSVNQASSIISHLDIEPHQLILWTILSMRWPILCEYLTRYPGVIYPESVDGNSITTPENIKLLLQDAEVKSVLSGSDTGSGLSRLTIEKGRSLLV